MSNISENLKRLVGAGVLLFGAYSCYSLYDSVFAKSDPAPSASTQDPLRDPKFLATVAAESFVKRQLKAPGTAEFGDETVTPRDDGDYDVVGWVDSQNSFGAKLRADFRTTLRREANGDWTAIAGPTLTER